MTYRGAMPELNGKAVEINGEYGEGAEMYYTLAGVRGRFCGRYESRGNYLFLVLTPVAQKEGTK